MSAVYIYELFSLTTFTVIIIHFVYNFKGEGSTGVLFLDLLKNETSLMFTIFKCTIPSTLSRQ